MERMFIQLQKEDRRKFFLVSALLSLLIITDVRTVFCQNDFKTTVVPPSPTSSVFLRYGNDQPSLQTGTVNIPISLFNIQAKGLNIPLTLTYQTSGINISDVPYPAGYGWVFSPGFRITREILGRADERFQFRASNASEDYETLKPGIIDESIANLHQLSQGNLFDTQKDIFTLHMPSGSINFFIKKNGNSYVAVSIGHQVKIEPIFSTTELLLTGFIVTDSDGIIYKFGYDANSSFLDYTEPLPFAGYTAWMLREIVLLNNDKITFSWQKVNTNAYAPKVSAPISIKDRKDQDCSSLPAYEVDDFGGIIDYSSYSGANALMLKKIDYPNGVVDLTYKSYQDPFLQSIIIKNKNNEIAKAINFSYGTNEANGSNRLLYSLNINNEIYNFQYNSNYFGSQTTGLDYWGFYNGKTDNLSLIPKMKLKIFLGHANVGAIIWPTAYIEFGNADRSVSAEFMKAFMLTKISYPTGGYSDYEYEPHQFPGQSVHSNNGDLFLQNPDPISSGGGLRVSKITTYASEGSVPIIKTYKYGQNEDGMANVSVVPTLETFINEYGHAQEETAQSCVIIPMGIYWRAYRQMDINSMSKYSKFLISKNPVWYSSVTEYINNEDKTEYTFSYDDTYAISWQPDFLTVKSPYRFRYDNLFNSGPKLMTSTKFKKIGTGYTPVQQLVNEYETIQNYAENISNVIIDRKGIYSHLNVFNFPGPDSYPPGFYPGGTYPNGGGIPIFSGDLDYQKFIYSIAVQYDRLKKTSTTLYDNNQAVTNYEDFFYNGYGQLIKTVRGTSINDQKISVENKYPIDFTGIPVYNDMVARNIVSPVIEQSTYKIAGTVNTFLSSKKTNYDYWNGYAWSTSGANNIVPRTIDIKSKNQTSYETRLRYFSYDDKGNVHDVSKENDVKQTYLWGYNKTYPVAEIIGADYATALQYITQNVLNYPPDDATFRSQLNNLRNIPGAIVTTYTYKPLAGMTSATDPNGHITYYEYDGLGRLVLVRDQNGKIFKKYCYNYQGQQEQCNLFENTAINGYYYSQNCSAGQTSVAYYVSVPANMFHSTISKPDADQKAQQYAQNLANQYGSCALPDVSIFYQKYPGIDFTIRFHNVASGLDYWFTIYAAQYSDILGDVPPGSYDITLIPGDSGWYYYSVGCGYQNDGSGTITFYGIDINSMCYSITID